MTPGRAYRTDLSDARWTLIEPILAAWRAARGTKRHIATDTLGLLLLLVADDRRTAGERARLLDGPRWEAMRADVMAGLSLTRTSASTWRSSPGVWTRRGGRWRPGWRRPGTRAKVEIVVPEGGGRAKLSVDKLGAVGEPEALRKLRLTVEAMLPRIDLPDLRTVRTAPGAGVPPLYCSSVTGSSRPVGKVAPTCRHL